MRLGTDLCTEWTIRPECESGTSAASGLDVNVTE
jgi:hypothetical protein